MMKMWGDFAKTGNPTPADGKWRPWDSVGQAKMNINQVPLCRPTNFLNSKPKVRNHDFRSGLADLIVGCPRKMR
jgi:hypothetical protein